MFITEKLPILYNRNHKKKGLGKVGLGVLLKKNDKIPHTHVPTHTGETKGMFCIRFLTITKIIQNLDNIWSTDT